MEKMEGKTESLELVNENNGWLIIEFKTFPFYNFFIFLVKGLDGKDGG
jgi:hypothetical protein